MPKTDIVISHASFNIEESIIVIIQDHSLCFEDRLCDFTEAFGIPMRVPLWLNKTIRNIVASDFVFQQEHFQRN